VCHRPSLSLAHPSSSAMCCIAATRSCCTVDANRAVLRAPIAPYSWYSLCCTAGTHSTLLCSLIVLWALQVKWDDSDPTIRKPCLVSSWELSLLEGQDLLSTNQRRASQPVPGAPTGQVPDPPDSDQTRKKPRQGLTQPPPPLGGAWACLTPLGGSGGSAGAGACASLQPPAWRHLQAPPAFGWGLGVPPTPGGGSGGSGGTVGRGTAAGLGRGGEGAAVGGGG